MRTSQTNQQTQQTQQTQRVKQVNNENKSNKPNAPTNTTNPIKTLKTKRPHCQLPLAVAWPKHAHLHKQILFDKFHISKIFCSCGFMNNQKLPCPTLPSLHTDCPFFHPCGGRIADYTLPYLRSDCIGAVHMSRGGPVSRAGSLVLRSRFI
jgi:hypothetical protein